MMGAHGGATICFRSLEVEGKGRNGNTTPGDSRTSHKISALKIPFFTDTATLDKPSVRLSWENKQADHGFVHGGGAVGTQDHVLCRNTHLVISQCLRNIKCHHWL